MANLWNFRILDHPDVDYRNAVIFLKNRSRPLEDILLEAKQVFQQLLQWIQTWPAEELIAPERTEWFVKHRWKQSRLFGNA